jgi:hypothetical protein
VRSQNQDDAGRQHDEEREGSNRYSAPVHASIVRLGLTRVNGAQARSSWVLRVP